MTVRVADAVGAELARLGADVVFGVVGSGNFHVTNALIAGGARFVAARHEGGAATMADSWARTCGRPGIVSVHQGPGLTNAMTGITEAAKSRTPLLVLAAEAPGLRSNFHLDLAGLAAAVGAEHERLHSPAAALNDVRRAYQTALERRTVILALPLDVQGANLDPGDNFSARILGPAPLPPVPLPPAPLAPAPEAVEALAGLLRAARRPVFIAGRGARSGRAALDRAAQACGALLATSAAAKGLFRGDPWDLDVSGGFASPLAAELITDADVIVGWGCSLNMWTTRHGKLLGPDAVIVQVDDDESAIGAHRPVRLGVVGDVALTAHALADVLASQRGSGRGGSGRGGSSRDSSARDSSGRDGSPRDSSGRDRAADRRDPSPGSAGRDGDAAARSGNPDTTAGYRMAAVRDRIAREVRWRDVPYADEGDAAHIDPRTLSIALDDRLPAERIVAVDSGNFMGYPSMFLSVPDQAGFCFTQSFQSIGLGLASAIGAAVARPDRLPVAALGDGGALMGISELETVVRLGIGMVIVVYDDEAYGAEVHHFGPDDEPLDTVRFPPTDIAAIARGFGCEAITARSTADLAGIHDWLNGPRDRPLLIDAKVSSTHGSWWLEEAFRGH